MKLKYDFEMIEMGDEYVSVPTGENSNDLRGVFKLNKEGWEVFQLLHEDTSEEDMIDVLEARYDNDRESIAQYVHEAVRILRENGVIQD